MAERENPDYEIGYRRPPKGSRFQPGQSGNPKGRPKGAKNLVNLINAELDTKVIINEGGKRRHITKREAIAKQMVNGAAKGDIRVLHALLKLDVDSDATADAPERPLSDDDRKTLAAFLTRRKQTGNRGGERDE